MKTRFFIMLFAFAAILLAFGGCRYRIHSGETDSPSYGAWPHMYTQDLPEEISPPGDTYQAPQEQPEVPPAPPETTMPESPAPTSDAGMPDAEDISYIPLAHIEAAADDLSPQTIEIVNEDARQYGAAESDYSDSNAGVESYDDIADSTVTVEEPTESEGQAVIGEEGGVIGLVAAYSTLLRQGVNTVFPCQLFNIYCETSEDFVTVGRGSAMYQLMVDAGGLNVSSRLTDDRLTVTADWVVRRNPDIIVKFVDAAVLGDSVTSTHAASEQRSLIMARPGWGATEAVRNNRVILLSDQMLESEETRLAAILSIARLMYPELFENIDVGTAIANLIIEIGGIHIYEG